MNSVPSLLKEDSSLSTLNINVTEIETMENTARVTLVTGTQIVAGLLSGLSAPDTSIYKTRVLL